MILHSLNSAARYRPEIQACGAAVRGQPPAVFFKKLFADFSVMIHHAHSTLMARSPKLSMSGRCIQNKSIISAVHTPTPLRDDSASTASLSDIRRSHMVCWALVDICWPIMWCTTDENKSVSTVRFIYIIAVELIDLSMFFKAERKQIKNSRQPVKAYRLSQSKRC